MDSKIPLRRDLVQSLLFDKPFRIEELPEGTTRCFSCWSNFGHGENEVSDPVHFGCDTRHIACRRCAYRHLDSGTEGRFLCPICKKKYCLTRGEEIREIRTLMIRDVTFSRLHMLFWPEYAELLVVVYGYDLYTALDVLTRHSPIFNRLGPWQRQDLWNITHHGSFALVRSLCSHVMTQKTAQQQIELSILDAVSISAHNFSTIGATFEEHEQLRGWCRAVSKSLAGLLLDQQMTRGLTRTLVEHSNGRTSVIERRLHGTTITYLSVFEIDCSTRSPILDVLLRDVMRPRSLVYTRADTEGLNADLILTEHVPALLAVMYAAQSLVKDRVEWYDCPCQPCAPETKLWVLSVIRVIRSIDGRGYFVGFLEFKERIRGTQEWKAAEQICTNDPVGGYAGQNGRPVRLTNFHTFADAVILKVVMVHAAYFKQRPRSRDQKALDRLNLYRREYGDKLVWREVVGDDEDGRLCYGLKYNKELKLRSKTV
ncbi:hypothetical protein LTR66_003000 [Elasticomyces elasticus]|nr:hypothetical protein LTR66_003000 [Elasticomyces elasticus]